MYVCMYVYRYGLPIWLCVYVYHWAGRWVGMYV